MAGYQINQGAADHDSVGQTSHRLGRFGVLDAKTDRARQLTALPERLYLPFHMSAVKTSGAGHPLQRNIINEAAGHAADSPHAVGASGRRHHGDHVNAALPVCGPGSLSLLIRHIHDQRAVHSGGRRLIGEAVKAHKLNRVLITHKNHRCFGVKAAKFLNHLQDLRQTDLVGQGALTSGLNDRAIGHRVRKRHP